MFFRRFFLYFIDKDWMIFLFLNLFLIWFRFVIKSGRIVGSIFVFGRFLCVICKRDMNKKFYRSLIK